MFDEVPASVRLQDTHFYASVNLKSKDAYSE